MPGGDDFKAALVAALPGDEDGASAPSSPPDGGSEGGVINYSMDVRLLQDLVTAMFQAVEGYEVARAQSAEGAFKPLLSVDVVSAALYAVVILHVRDLLLPGDERIPQIWEQLSGVVADFFKDTMTAEDFPKEPPTPEEFQAVLAEHAKRLQELDAKSTSAKES